MNDRDMSEMKTMLDEMLDSKLATFKTAIKKELGYSKCVTLMEAAARLSHVTKDGVVTALNTATKAVNEQVEAAVKEFQVYVQEDVQKHVWRSASLASLSLVGMAAVLDSIAFADTWLHMDDDCYKHIDPKSIYYKSHKFSDAESNRISSEIKKFKVGGNDFFDLTNTAKHATMFLGLDFSRNPPAPFALLAAKDILKLVDEAVQAFTRKQHRFLSVGMAVDHWKTL